MPLDDWPDLDALNVLASGIRTSGGQPLRFVPAALPGDDVRRPYYELHIAQSGEVPTRERNWHDLFNALAWVTWPRAKSRINAQHVALLEAGGPGEARQRSPARDALTLFDEGGVVVASSAEAPLHRLRAFAWKELFWERRAELQAHVRFFAFGHGCLEQALTPYIGMVAKTVFVRVDAAFLASAVGVQVATLDAALERHFGDAANFPSPKAMAPLPLLGVPGWHERTAEAAFYDDAAYFRSRPRPARSTTRGG